MGRERGGDGWNCAEVESDSQSVKGEYGFTEVIHLPARKKHMKRLLRAWLIQAFTRSARTGTAKYCIVRMDRVMGSSLLFSP